MITLQRPRLKLVHHLSQVGPLPFVRRLAPLPGTGFSSWMRAERSERAETTIRRRTPRTHRVGSEETFEACFQKRTRPPWATSAASARCSTYDRHQPITRSPYIRTNSARASSSPGVSCSRVSRDPRVTKEDTTHLGYTIATHRSQSMKSSMAVARECRSAGGHVPVDGRHGGLKIEASSLSSPHAFPLFFSGFFA